MWVVKLGGSLDAAGHLRQWARALAEADVPLILVPGGGRFADAVRVAQGRWDLDDATAHRMAILAMELTAQMLCGMCDRLIPASGLLSTDVRDAERQTRVWLPTADLLGDPDIPPRWDVTSDSLAAILARRIGAEALVLVKSAPLNNAPSDVRALQAAGILDASFHRYGAGCGCPVWLLPAERSGGLNSLARGELGASLCVLFDGAGGEPRDDRISTGIAEYQSPAPQAVTAPFGADTAIGVHQGNSAHSHRTK